MDNCSLSREFFLAFCIIFKSDLRVFSKWILLEDIQKGALVLLDVFSGIAFEDASSNLGSKESSVLSIEVDEDRLT